MSDDNAKQVDDLRKYYPWMVRRARLYVPEYDAEQVANAALCDAHAPDRDRPPPTEVPRIKVWLDELIALRAMAYRKERRKYANEMPCEDVSVVAYAQTVDLEKQIADRQCIRMMLESLPYKRREVFVAYTVDGMPVDQIADAYRIKEKTVYVWVHFARNVLRAKWDELCADTWKRIGLLFPFLFLRRVWRRIASLVHGPGNREARAAGAGIAGTPVPWIMGAVASVFVLGFTPSRPSAVGNEHAEVPIHAANRDETVIPAIHHVEITGRTGISTRQKDATAIVRVPKATKKTPGNAQSFKRSVPNDESTDARDTALLTRARAAYNKGKYAKANALLDEHEATFPKSRFADLRNGLREVTAKAMATARQ